MHLAVNISFNKSTAWDGPNLFTNSAFGRNDSLYHILLMHKKLNPADLQVLLLCTYLSDNAYEKVTLWVTGGITNVTSLCRTETQAPC